MADATFQTFCWFLVVPEDARSVGRGGASRARRESARVVANHVSGDERARVYDSWPGERGRAPDVGGGAFPVLSQYIVRVGQRCIGVQRTQAALGAVRLSRTVGNHRPDQLIGAVVVSAAIGAGHQRTAGVAGVGSLGGVIVRGRYEITGVPEALGEATRRSECRGHCHVQLNLTGGYRCDYRRTGAASLASAAVQRERVSRDDLVG